MADIILEKLEKIGHRFEEITRLLSLPETVTDQKKYVSLNKEYRELEVIVEASKQYEDIRSNIDTSKEILDKEKDAEMREMAKMELDELTNKKKKIIDEIKLLLLPKDIEDDKNAIIEIRAGTGGDEAGIFAGDLYKMYTRYCESKKWNIEVTNFAEASAGGFKEVIMNISGDGVYGILKYESGVHRVQRIPKTESQGRVHTSAASVAILPEAEDVDIELKDEDFRKDTYCSSGPGGQSVNTTYSAIRLTHIATGLVVTCQDEKSQLKNFKAAKRELRTRLYNIEYQKHMDEISAKRRTMVSSGDRSAKIRTYNFPQGRVTDHRINLTMYNLQEVLGGEIDEIIEKLQLAENVEKLKESGV